jgi:hypothetical protein
MALLVHRIRPLSMLAGRCGDPSGGAGRPDRARGRGHSRNLKVRSRLEDADVYAPTVAALTRLFEASISSGNPVI